MDNQAIRARLLEELKQAEARLREREAAYLKCVHGNATKEERDAAYQAVLDAIMASDAAYDRYLASDPD